MTLRGSARGSNLEALPQQGQIFPNVSRIWPQPGKKCPNPPRFLPKPSPNPPQILPRPSQTRPKRPLGAHLGAMLEKSCILNAQNTSKSRPRAAQSGPRPPQPPPKSGPRPAQIRFLGEFLVCFFQLYNFFIFFSIFS